MIDPRDVGLPYPSWSPGQWDTITEILLALEEYKYVLVEAPTGSGKSAVSLASYRFAGPLPGKLQVVTGTKQLQDQYEDLGLFKLMGRNNFDCNAEPYLTADRGVCTIGQDCSLRLPLKMDGVEVGPPECDYYRQRWVGLRNEETVFNYAYWLAMQNYAGWRKAGLLVLDEAHALEDEIRRFSSLRLTHRHVESLIDLHVTWPFVDDDIEIWQDWAAEHYAAVVAEWQWVEDNSVLAGRTRHGAVKAVFDVIQGVMKAGVSDDTWVVVPTINGVEFLPVWVADLAHDAVFSHADKVVMMSATILDRDMFCEQLGLHPDDVAFIQIPSVFPAENRPLYYEPAGKIRATNEPGLRVLCSRVDAIIDKYHGKSGLVHTGSYKIARYLMTHSRHTSRVLSHATKDRQAKIQLFRDTPGAVLVSPSVTTGVDLPYELCEFQIICKIPFPDRGDPQVARRMKESAPGVPNSKGQSWYNWVTICNVVQAYGRGMRAADDHCDTYLLDSNWNWFKRAVSTMLPEWFREAIHYPKVSEGTADDIRRQIAARV